jgi:hypothetical protein
VDGWVEWPADEAWDGGCEGRGGGCRAGEGGCEGEGGWVEAGEEAGEVWFGVFGFGGEWRSGAEETTQGGEEWQWQW